MGNPAIQLPAAPLPGPSTPPPSPPLLRPVLPVVEREEAPKKRRTWPIWVAALVFALACAVGAIAYVRSRPVAATFRTVPVVVVDITQRVTATGTLQPIITSPVGAQVSGIVWKLHADYNSEVKQGQLLVELDPALFKNAVAIAEAQLGAATSNASSARAGATGAKNARDRTANLQRSALASQADLDAIEASFEQSMALARSGDAQVAQARAQLDRARLDLQHSVVRSPASGTVISRNVEVGQAVAATLTAPTLFTIAQDLRHMQVHAAVDEADIGDVHAGLLATFTVDAFRDVTFHASVNTVRNAPQTAQNVVTYDVVLDVDNLEGKLRPGMTANILILIAQKSQIAAVPNEALRFRPAATAAPGKASVKEGRASTAVYVADGVRAVRVPIKTGITDGNFTEVQGLGIGRSVITDTMKSKSTATAGGGGRGF